MIQDTMVKDKIHFGNLKENIESVAGYYERLASLFATWQMRGLDVQMELRQMLIKNLCLS